MPAPAGMLGVQSLSFGHGWCSAFSMGALSVDGAPVPKWPGSRERHSRSTRCCSNHSHSKAVFSRLPPTAVP